MRKRNVCTHEPAQNEAVVRGHIGVVEVDMEELELRQLYESGQALRSRFANLAGLRGSPMAFEMEKME